MKRQKYIKNMIKIIIILILVSFLGQNVYAENETGEGTTESSNSQNENTGSTNTSGNTESTAPESSTGGSSTSSSSSSSSSNSGSSSSGSSATMQTTTKKSSDATLSNLGIRPNDFSGFKSGTTTYNVTVPADVEQVEVYATATSSKATISGTGTKTLQEGNNALSVIVTAEDGTQKTYTINVTRSSAENTENVPAEANGQGLASLTIENLELSPSFDTNTYTYTVKYIGEAESLNIQTTTTDPYYNVEIAGNEGLVEGENVITILVTDPDDNNIATYQITVNKSLVDEEALAREQEELERQQQQRRMIIIGVVVAVVIIIAIILIIRHRRNKAWAEEYTVPYGGLDDDDYNYDDNYNMNFNNGNITFDDDDEIQEVEPLEEVNQFGDEEVLNKNTENNEQEKTPEELEKERIRQQFLSGYENEGFNFDDDDDFSYEPRKRRHKGKRFK